MFSYFYGQQAEQFSFYRIPKVLFTNPQFRYVSAEAKTLYGILLDRMNLSAKNGWQDEDGRVFIIFTVEEIMESLNCGNKKAISLLAELETKAGLIERRRQGLGKPNLIYVKNFIPTASDPSGHFLKCQNDTSGNVDTTLQEMSIGHSSNTDLNNTDVSNTDPFFPSGDGDEEMGKRERYRAYFMERLDYDQLVSDRYDSRDVDEILELLIDTCCTARKWLRVAGDDKPAEVVKSSLMKLESGHIQFVLDSLRENTTRVRNMKQYLLAALYNAPLTMHNYFTARVSHDMANL